MTKYPAGCVASPPDSRDYLAAAPSPQELAALPARFDVGHQPPVVNQGSEGTCVGQAGKGTLDHHLLAAELARAVSARDIYEGARGLEPVSGEGAYIRAALEYLRKTGACRAEDWPYQADAPGTPGPGAPAARPLNRLASYVRLDTGYDALRVALWRFKSPLVIRVETCDGFNEPTTDGLVRPIGRAGGGHAIVIVGYDHTRRAFRIRNSWGADWGQGGYAWLPSDYGITEAWATRPAVLPEPPPAPPPAPKPWWLAWAWWL